MNADELKKWILPGGLVILAMVLLAITGLGGRKELMMPPSGNLVTNTGSQESSALESVEPTPTESQTEPSTEPEIPLLNENPLTGVFDLTDGAVNKRPVAVMINNVKKALPQYGISKADIIFEIPVEGFLTRFMAIYGDYTQMPKICSIRSCRPYFPAIAKGFDAVYVYSGMASGIRPYVNSLDIAVFEGGRNHGGLFGRDQDRRDEGYSLEHTMYFDATGIVAAMEDRKMRSDISENKAGNVFCFCDTEDVVLPAGADCSAVRIDFGAAKANLFYDAENHVYLKNFGDNPQIDGVTGEQLSFTNVFVLETKIGTAANGIHKDVNWTSGTGYYISQGKMESIKWKKSDEASDMVFYKENGEELVINRGKSYIAINRPGRTEFE